MAGVGGEPRLGRRRRVRERARGVRAAGRRGGRAAARGRREGLSLGLLAEGGDLEPGRGEDAEGFDDGAEVVRVGGGVGGGLGLLLGEDELLFSEEDEEDEEEEVMVRELTLTKLRRRAIVLDECSVAS